MTLGEMMSSGHVTAEDAVLRLSLALGEEHRLIGPLTGGETGATAIEAPDGTRLVLKWELDPASQARRRTGLALAERLRTEAGWPVPRQRSVVHDDCLLVVQEHMEGEAVTRLTHEIVDEVLELHDRRLGLLCSDDPDRWAGNMIETLVDGGDGYCLHEPLRDHDERTRRIIERIEEIGRSLQPGDVAGCDIVHHDLHPGNMLQQGDRLSAVIDLDFTQVGDAAFDLTALAVSSLGVEVERGVRTKLFTAGVHCLPVPRRSAYVAHLLLRNLDWPIRKGRSEEVDFWVARSDELLPT